MRRCCLLPSPCSKRTTSNASRPTPARYSRHAPGWPGSTRCACCARRLRRFLREHGESDDDNRLAVLLGACDLERQWRPLRRQLAALQQSLGLAALAADAGPELANLAGHASQQLREIQTLARSLAQAPRAEQLDAVILTGEKQRFEALLGDLDAALIRQAARQLSLDKLKVLADWLGDDLLEQLHRAIAGNQSNLPALGRLREALPQLVAYQRFRGRAGQLEATELEFLALLRQRQERLDAIPAEALEATVRRMLNREARLGWKQRLEQDNPELLFSQDEARARVASLAEADVQMRALNRELLGKGIDAARLGSRKQWEDVTRLTGKRSRRLREFIELGAELGLMSLRPVWLMNPDLASRVLPLKAGLFDMVIYDEASQMPVEFALPTLYRGRVTVVSGDKKQMPPTAFFSSRVESDEAELFDGEAPDEDADEEQREAYEDTWNRREIKDCPDLLQLARNALPSTTLQIHYRSAYRELIGFSNASFYGNRLSVPVRHPQANILRIKPLELIQVNGLYQNQSNEREAERVVDYLAELWRQPYAARPSVGVVTFNRKQADLIEERLELRAEQDETFRAAYSEERERSEDGEDMGVFVKNVENAGRRARRDRLHLRPQRPGQLPAQLRRARADRRRAPPQRGGDPRAAQGGDDHLDADRRHLRHARHPALAEQPARLPARLPGIRPRTVRRRVRRYRPTARAPAHRPQRPAPPALPAARRLQRDRRRVHPLAGLVRRTPAKATPSASTSPSRTRPPASTPSASNATPLPPAAGTRPRPGNLATLGAAAGDPAPPPGFLPGLVPRRRQRTHATARRHRESPGA